MQCNQSTIVNAFHRLSLYTSSPLGRRSISARNVLWHPLRHPRVLVRPSCAPPHWSASSALQILASSRPYAIPATVFPSLFGNEGSEDVPSEALPEPSLNQLTNAQVSRAASRAVRLCFKDGQISEALFILNCMALARYKGKSPDQIPPKLLQLPDPINFNPDVSRRPTAHCILHGLIRSGLAEKAVTLAHLMMEDGIKLRAATMKAIIDALTTTVRPPRMEAEKMKRLVLDFARYPEEAKVLELHTSMVTDETVRLALGLFMKARKYGHYKTRGMYESLINLCLLQGEILVACLLFVLLVKDWQMRKAITEQVIKSMSEASNGSLEQTSTTRVHIPKTGKARTFLPKPHAGILASILEAITASWDEATAARNPAQYLLPSMQGLASLASLLNDNLLPFTDISRLVKTMHSIPRDKTQAIVWTQGSQQPRQVEAYSYIHETLRRLFTDLPGSCDRDEGRPSVNANTYHSLLYYALRHRRSLSLAQHVLDHMQNVRCPPLSPSRTTFNILIRSGTVLGINGLAEHALLELRAMEADSKLDLHEVAVDPGQRETLDAESEAADDTDQDIACTSVDAAGVKSEHDNSSGIIHPPRDSRLYADRYTIPAFISHLVATGRPHVVADVLSKMLPELSAIDHPSRGSMSDHEYQALKKERLSESIRRAVAYGPYFFATVLRALSAAGKTGLCERVWMLAKQAERASWEPDSGVEPWCLSIHAYTSMMQCYAQEARKGLHMKGVSGYDEEISHWTPQSTDHVIGWASYILRRDRLAPHQLSRHNAAREMGILLFRSMRSVPLAVTDAMQAIKSRTGRDVALDRLALPQADARFYNAALGIFGRHPAMRAHKSRTSPSYWRRLIRSSIDAYMSSGRMSSAWTPGLQEVVEDLLANGFTLPIAFHQVFVGRELPIGRKRTRNKAVPKRAFADPPPPRPRFLPHSIPSPRTRPPVPKRYSRKTSDIPA
ncbi:hypothetical protein OE88DRAFT_1673470 [Heliocybe sulcata]|uniref:Uncharacterized protein n=1 Tax=Heliocybe sulcata TaxID=5364 RepID=A0A5C3NR76_9AGAM|nr:hypothetical protein OE88DRAFT_1673470 [Heliocybe sulcata]